MKHTDSNRLSALCKLAGGLGAALILMSVGALPTISAEESRVFGQVGGMHLIHVAHAIQACFLCHTPQKAQDFVFSTYIP